MSKAVRSGFIILAMLSAAGCVSARMSDHESNRLFEYGRYDEAAAHLKEGLASHGKSGGSDELLYLLDIGLSLHSAGKYEESNQYFFKADKIAEIKDYTSLVAEASTLLISDNSKDYKGEDFEKVLISTYLAMNYALMGDSENALVEARRVNHKLYMMITQGKRKYQQNPFARYLSAILYESDRNYNDAYVDYKNTYDLLPDFPDLGRDLWRMALVLGIRDDMEKWDEKYGLSAADHAAAKQQLPKAGKGEIIVLYENGISPVKVPNPIFPSLPLFRPRNNWTDWAEVLINGVDRGRTVVLDDIQATAIHNLDEKYGGMIAKKVGGLVAKELVGDAVGNALGSRGWGQLAKFALYAADQADLRSWNLLPRDLQITRLAVDPGTYQIQVRPGDESPLPEKTVQVGAGKKIFVDFRYMP